MEDILVQKITYATITPFKDYCLIPEKKKYVNLLSDKLDYLDDDDSDIFKIRQLFHVEPREKIGRIFSFPIKKKKKLHYFTNNDNVEERFTLEYLLKNKEDNTYDTISDRQIKRHYGRPFSSIIVSTIERSIRRNGDKITLKIFNTTKSRGVNCIYFKKWYEVHSITVNLKTGNITTATITKRGKTISKNFKTNSFFEIERCLMGKSIFNIHGFFGSNSKIKKNIENIFDNLKFTAAVQESLGIEMGCISYSSKPLQFKTDLCKVFIKLKNIKIPNGDFEFWISKFYPTEKFLKKNDRKLISSILDMLGIKSKSTIKILHEYPNIDIIGFYKVCRFFGNDFSKYLGNINPYVFENSVRKQNNFDAAHTKSTILNLKLKTYLLFDKEKENLIRIINSPQDRPSESIIGERFIQLLEDHFNMIEKIRDYDSDLYMKARTLKEFHDEHRELSKMVTAIKKGWVIEYKFNEKMVEDVEKPIPLKINLGTETEPALAEDMGISFYPVILKREEEYIEEGSFMHHCVATYADKEKSIIISVRTHDEQDRVTCEFNCQDGMLIQARHFCNRQPPADIEHVIINDLSRKVKKYARLGLLHAAEKIKVPLKINGVEVKKEEPTRLFGVDFVDFF
jgi:hypothetical protein